MSKTSTGEVNMQDIAPAQSTDYITPESILVPVRAYFGGKIPLDPATIASNPTKAKRFFTPAEDGLSKGWSRKGNFLNPPYGKEIREWVAKVHEQAEKGRIIIALLPCGARFSTKYWQDTVLTEWLTASCFVRGRIAFLREDGSKATGNPYDSMIYGFNVRPHKFAVHFGHLGKVFKMENLA